MAFRAASASYLVAEGPWKTKIPAWKRVLIFQSELPEIPPRPQMGNFLGFGQGASEGPFGTSTKIAPGQVAENSNLKWVNVLAELSSILLI